MGNVKYDEAKPIILSSHMVNFPYPIFEALYDSNEPIVPATKQTINVSLVLFIKNWVFPENQNIKLAPANIISIVEMSEKLFK